MEARIFVEIAGFPVFREYMRLKNHETRWRHFQLNRCKFTILSFQLDVQHQCLRVA